MHINFFIYLIVLNNMLNNNIINEFKSYSYVNGFCIFERLLR